MRSVCKGERKQSNHTRALILALSKGLVPADWLCYTVPKVITVMAWIHDFTERVQQLIRLAGSASLRVCFNIPFENLQLLDFATRHICGVSNCFFFLFRKKVFG